MISVGVLVSTVATATVLACGGTAYAQAVKVSEGVAPCGTQRGAESEPSVAVAPRDTRHMVVAWLTDDSGVVAAVTRDGGDTWKRGVVPGLTSCEGGELPLISHPHPVFDDEGRLFLVSFPRQPGGAEARILVSRSSDGGDSWEPPTRADLGTHDWFNDLDTVAVTPEGDLLIAWSPLEGNVAAETTFLARSSDGGRSWSQQLVRTALAGHSAWNRVLALRDGTLVLVFSEVTPAELFVPGAAGTPAPVSVVVSRDDGATWTLPVLLGTSTGLQWPSAAEGRDGRVHVSWVQPASEKTCRRLGGPDGDLDGLDGNIGGTCEVVAVRSDPARLTWSAPRRVGAWEGNWMPTPGLAVTGDGTIGMLRTTSTGTAATVWLSRSTDDGATWTDRRLADFELDGLDVSEPLGLYHQLTGRGCGFTAAYVAGTPHALSGPTDVLLRTVGAVKSPRACRLGPGGGV